MPATEADVLNALRELIDPVTGENFVDGKSVKNLKVEGDGVSLDLVLGYPARSLIESIRKQVTERLKKVPGVANASANVHSKIVSHCGAARREAGAGHQEHHRGGLGQGRGRQEHHGGEPRARARGRGREVGMLDADIYGPSQPTMLGITGRPTSKDGKTMEPMIGHGLQAMSVGFLIDMDTPMVWRGPMVTQALEQLLTETRWSDLDYLVVDLPPGTGDIQLTLAQKVPVTGAVIVTTPQDIALLDARKGLKMFEKVGIPIIGIVENMAVHICSKCGHAEHIFGEGGGERMCKEYKVDFLGALPLDISIREQADSGKPTVVSDPDGQVAQVYKQIARKVAAAIAKQSQDRTALFPKIVVQNT